MNVLDDLAAVLCFECGDRLGDEPTEPSTEPGWRRHRDCDPDREDVETLVLVGVS